MKVLWLSNCSLVDMENKGTGSWLFSMSKALCSRGIELYNITQTYDRELVEKQGDNIKEWRLPKTKLKNGLPPQKHINIILNIIDEIKPDIIHIWGVEFYWGLLTARGYIKGNILLEMQGLKSSCADVFYGGMNFKEILSTLRVKEFLLFNRSLIFGKRIFKKWGKFEEEILTAHRSISVQSEWVKARIKPFISKETKLFDTGIIVRNEFFEAEPWGYRNKKDNPVIFAMSSGAIAYKGIHILIKALSLLKKQYPNISLRLAGDFQQGMRFYRKSGYIKFLERLIKKYDLDVTFLGPLNAEELIEEMRNSDVMVQSSFVESYSLALAEAMAFGIPCVVSYAGAMPELAIDNESVLFYSPTDYFNCAYQINRLIESDKLSSELSIKAKEIASGRNKYGDVVETQMKIYSEMCK